ncbi:hypothetical protein NHX12_009131, partial [Muraenolepis orangiensis]
MCHSGWKGSECHVPTNQCIDVTCSGHGTCIVGTCICNPGYKGENCEEVDCLDPTCSGRGVCVRGECHCFVGWGGPGCESPRASCMDQCSGHGTFLPETGTCGCDPKWSGHDCSTGPRSQVQLKQPTRWHALAGNAAHTSLCRCEEGWGGAGCDQRACHPRCSEHGTCRDGRCECSPGWNGEHCTIEGCPGLCSGNGRCTLGPGGWYCVCQLGWRGPGCDTSMETACGDTKDNDGDGLVDCMDPDCCLQSSCHATPLCVGSPDPLDILQETQLSGAHGNLRSFYDRVHFLVGRESTHVIPAANPFDGSHACVIRGQVVTWDGTPLVGVNISFINNPAYGYTITRQDGSNRGCGCGCGDSSSRRCDWSGEEGPAGGRGHPRDGHEAGLPEQPQCGLQVHPAHHPHPPHRALQPHEGAPDGGRGGTPLQEVVPRAAQPLLRLPVGQNRRLQPEGLRPVGGLR